MADAERKALALEHVKQKLRSIAYVLKGQSPVELFRSFDVSASTPWQVCWPWSVGVMRGCLC